MFVRRCVQGLLLLCLGSTLAGCGNPSGLDSVQVTPATQSLPSGRPRNSPHMEPSAMRAHSTKQNITSTRDMELRHSFRSNRQHHRNGNCRVSRHNHDHG